MKRPVGRFGAAEVSRSLVRKSLVLCRTPGARECTDHTVTLIDCDLYKSTLSVLAFLEDLLQEGSMLLFDDWTVSDVKTTWASGARSGNSSKRGPGSRRRSGSGSVDAGRHASCTLGLSGSRTTGCPDCRRISGPATTARREPTGVGSLP